MRQAELMRAAGYTSCAAATIAVGPITHDQFHVFQPPLPQPREQLFVSFGGFAEAARQSSTWNPPPSRTPTATSSTPSRVLAANARRYRR